MIRKEKRSKYKERLIKITVLILFNIRNATSKSYRQSGIIYVLEYTPTDAEPFNFLETGRQAFVTRNCGFQNCFLTSNHSYFDDIQDFDVLIFNAAHMNLISPDTVPKRAQYQKYIMVAMEPAGFFPIAAPFNDFFNFTWTYKLDSDVPFPYVIVKNEFGQVIGPKIDMQWMKIQNMNRIQNYVKRVIKKKYLAAAWFASNCLSYKRFKFVRELNEELAKYGQSIDIYGKCGSNQCPKQSMMDECYFLIKSKYYFYLAFENSFGVDYVSEKILHALRNFAVPVVLGGANYTRFMPDGIYLNALNLGPEQLAKRMNEIIIDTNQYFEFFKWHGHYTFHLSSEDSYRREVCGLCELLNNKTLMNKTTIVSNVTKWWNEEYPGFFSNATNAPENYSEGEQNLPLLRDENDDSKGIMSILFNILD